MRSVLIAGLAAALLAPAMAQAQEAKPLAPEDIAPAPPPDAAPVAPPGDGPHPGDPAPPPAVTPGGPLHPGDENLPPDAYDAPAKPKPKVGEAAGGLAGGVLGQVVGTAAGGLAGGIAASLVGDKIGLGMVRMGKKIPRPRQEPARRGRRRARRSPPSGGDGACAPARASPARAADARPAEALRRVRLNHLPCRRHQTLDLGRGNPGDPGSPR